LSRCQPFGLGNQTLHAAAISCIASSHLRMSLQPGWGLKFAIEGVPKYLDHSAAPVLLVHPPLVHFRFGGIDESASPRGR
jgi:hypothetical protein